MPYYYHRVFAMSRAVWTLQHKHRLKLKRKADGALISVGDAGRERSTRRRGNDADARRFAAPSSSASGAKPGRAAPALTAWDSWKQIVRVTESMTKPPLLRLLNGRLGAELAFV